jgi:hypothetical protein
MGAALVIAACGGDDSPEQVITIPTDTTATSTEAEGALTKTDFIAQADPICEEANSAIQAFADAGQGLTEADEIAGLRAGVISDLNALGPPAEDKETLDQFLAAMEQQVAAGEKIALANERGTDTAQFETELADAKSAAATAGSAYGFQSCGSEVTSSSTTDTGSTDSGTVVPAEPAPTAPAPDTGTGGGTGDTGGGGDTGGVGTGGGVGPG